MKILAHDACTFVLESPDDMSNHSFISPSNVGQSYSEQYVPPTGSVSYVGGGRSIVRPSWPGGKILLDNSLWSENVQRVYLFLSLSRRSPQSSQGKCPFRQARVSPTISLFLNRYAMALWDLRHLNVDLTLNGCSETLADIVVDQGDPFEVMD